MDNINPSEVFQQRLAQVMGMDKYKIIIDGIWNTDVSTDADYQKTYNGFYMVRRNEEWRKCYYTFFERIKNQKPTFSDILLYLYEHTGQVEASFSSKMLSTIDPSMPIWDQYVIHNLGLKPPPANDPERLQKVIRMYESICAWYKSYLQTDNAAECIKKFDEVLPDYAWFSDIKKMDFFLWSIR